MQILKTLAPTLGPVIAQAVASDGKGACGAGAAPGGDVAELKRAAPAKATAGAQAR